MSLIERKQRQQIEIKNQIIDCSRRIVEESGWNALSIRKIADAIEYSVPVIYKHFENKEAISSYFVKEGFQKLISSLNESIDSSADPQTKTNQFAKGYWKFAATNPKHYEIMFGLGIPSCETIGKIEELKIVSTIMLSLIDELIQSSKNTGIDRHLKLKTLWSILHGIIAVDLLAFQQRDNICPSEVFKDAIEGFTKSILY